MASTTAKDRYETAYSDDIRERVGTYDWKAVAGLPARGLKILNVGGGDSADLWHLVEENDVFLVDGAKSGVESAQAHGIKASLADLESPLSFPDEKFDVVICKDVLEHLVAPINLAQEMNRVLKPDGVLVVSVPNHFYLLFRIRMMLGGNLIWKTLFHDHTTKYDEWDYMHLRFFTYRGFCRFLQIGGFVPVRHFWDIGTLAHYTEPEAFHLHMKAKYANRPLTRKAKLYFRFLRPAYNVFNTLFPKSLRSSLVSFAPGVLCAGFYFHCRKSASRGASG